MNWVNFNSSSDVEACLFKTKRHTASASEKIDSYRSDLHFGTLAEQSADAIAKKNPARIAPDGVFFTLAMKDQLTQRRAPELREAAARRCS